MTPAVFVWNGIWTFLTLVPFATRWVGEHPNDTLPEFLYVLVMLLWSLMFQLMDNRIVKDFPGTPPDETNNARVRLPMYLGYGVAMLVSFFVPILSLVMLLVIVAVMSVGIFRMMCRKA